MTWLLAALAVTVIVVGVVGTVVPGLPGAVLVLVGLVWLAWLDGFDHVGGGTIAVLVGLTAGCYAVELIATAVGASYAGASRWVIAGAVAGTIVGLLFGLPGLLLGPLIGAVGAEYLARGTLLQATRAGLGAWVGVRVGSAVKIALVLSMVGVTTAAYLWP